jgi:hypothetical protein
VPVMTLKFGLMQFKTLIGAVMLKGLGSEAKLSSLIVIASKSSPGPHSVGLATASEDRA